MIRFAVVLRRGGLSAVIGLLSACAVIPRDPRYAGPITPPATVAQYYAYSSAAPYRSFSAQVVTEKGKYVHKRILIDTEYGQITVDHYERRDPTENLIFVFPILGGKHLVEGYFAKYFANRGFDTAIVHRDKDFKRPEMFDSLEQVFRNNVIRDRIAIDFFERERGKRKFGSFGISRGAINAASTAGIEPRLKFNVFALGASHLVDVFKRTDVRGVEKYRNNVKELKNISDEQFYAMLQDGLKTDPRYLAPYIDARNTLLILSAFDHAVPIKYGMKLRRELGTPKTIFLASGHYTALLYTQFIKLLPPSETICIFPFDFVESESLRFYNEAFDTKRVDFFHLPLVILQLPFLLLGKLYYALF